jgi:hypothetical protein
VMVTRGWEIRRSSRAILRRSARSSRCTAGETAGGGGCGARTCEGDGEAPVKARVWGNRERMGGRRFRDLFAYNDRRRWLCVEILKTAQSKACITIVRINECV